MQEYVEELWKEPKLYEKYTMETIRMTSSCRPEKYVGNRSTNKSENWNNTKKVREEGKSSHWTPFCLNLINEKDKVRHWIYECIICTLSDGEEIIRKHKQKRK